MKHVITAEQENSGQNFTINNPKGPVSLNQIALCPMFITRSMSDDSFVV